MTDRHSHAHSNGSNEISVTVSDNTVILLNINFKTQYGSHYGDKETMPSKYLL